MHQARPRSRATRSSRSAPGGAASPVHAAADYGCRVTTTTISDAQFEVRRQAGASRPGSADRVTVLNARLPGPRRHLRQAGLHRDDRGGRLASSTTPSSPPAPDCSTTDGLMALQAITMDDRSFERAKNGTRLRAGRTSSRGLPPLDRGDHPLVAPGHPAGRGRPRGHRPALRRDPPPLARQRRPARRRASTALGLDYAVPAAVELLPLLLRGRLPRAPHQRRADGHGHARLAGPDVRSATSPAHLEGRATRPRGPGRPPSRPGSRPVSRRPTPGSSRHRRPRRAAPP